MKLDAYSFHSESHPSENSVVAALEEGLLQEEAGRCSASLNLEDGLRMFFPGPHSLRGDKPEQGRPCMVS